MGSLENLAEISATSGITFKPSYTCLSCPALIKLGSFPALKRVRAITANPASSVLLTFLPGYTCQGCSSLTQLASFPMLQTLLVTTSTGGQASLAPVMRFTFIFILF
jgi:hypothetical protein